MDNKTTLHILKLLDEIARCCIELKMIVSGQYFPPATFKKHDIGASPEGD